MVSLFDLGFTPAQLAGVDPRLHVPGRVTEEQKQACRVWTEAGPVWARAAGRLEHAGERPVVGDYVLLRRGAEAEQGDGWRHVDAILPRRSALRRKAVGAGSAEQLIAANVDVVFLVNSFNRDLNERRLERYLLVAWDAGAVPVVVLSKADLPGDREEALARLSAVALGAPVVVVSALTGEGLDEVRGHVGPGRTAAFLGSSGVGKSTLINALLGAEALATSEIRGDDDKGRHTTTHRSLWLLPGGGLVVDTPGMRELMPLADDDAVTGVFAEVEEVAARCRFSNCRHAGEPGCAIEAALADGELDAGRYAAWGKAQREQAFLARKTDARLAAEERKKWKAIGKAQRQQYRMKKP